MEYASTIDFLTNNTMTIIINEIEKKSKVLEFGPASGRLTKYLKEEKECEVSIVEIDEDAARIASKYAAHTVVGDIEKYEWLDKYSDLRFDYIVFADVLEHLHDAKKALSQAKALLKEDGFILISMPNIAHNSVIIDLFRNRFDYRKTGIMDRTHLKFWTEKSIDELVEKSGLYTHKKMATYSQVGFNEFDNSYDTPIGINTFYLKKRVNGEVYQYVYKIGKNPAEELENRINPVSDYYYYQCFVSDGGELKHICKKIIDFREKELTISIDLPDSVEKVRIDPINKASIMKVKSIIGYIGDDAKKMDITISNADFVYNNYYAFYNNDCQLWLENIDSNCKKIVCTIKIMAVERFDSNEFCKLMMKLNTEYSETIEQKENYICEQREIISERETSIRELSGIVEQKENYICEQRAEISDRDNNIRELNGIIEQKENYICEQRGIIEQKENYICEQRGIIEQKENYICEQRNELEDLKKRYEKLTSNWMVKLVMRGEKR